MVSLQTFKVQASFDDLGGENGSQKASGDLIMGDSEPKTACYPRYSLKHLISIPTHHTSYGIRHQRPTQAAGMGGLRGNGICLVS